MSKAPLQGPFPSELVDYIDTETRWQEAVQAKAERLVPRKIDPEVWGFRPLGHRVVVLRGEAEEITEGGIHIPMGAQEPPTFGWIINVGPEVGQPNGRLTHQFMGIAPIELVGLKVLFPTFSGQPLTFTALASRTDLEYGTFVIMTENDILGLDFTPTKPLVGDTDA